MKVRRPPQPAQRNLVAALDVGSSKVCALIAEPGEDGRLKILGTGQRESRGVKRGFIADMEKSEIAIRESVEQAERIAGTQVDQVFVGFSAGGLVSDDRQRRGRRSAGGGSPAPTSTSCSRRAARSIDPEGRMILHALPAYYTIDGVDGVKQPRGLHAEKLGVDIHVIAADPAPCEEPRPCASDPPISGVEAIVASPVAAGKACLSEEERELGVALVELGGGVTNVSVFAGGMLVGLEVARRWAAATSPTTSPPPSAPAGSRPSGSNASTARR